jgi:excisionase family DNA binding protein
MRSIKSGYPNAVDSQSHHLTTGEAAELCSVKPVTVLKWLEMGQLRAAKTAGGHHRVEYHDLQSFLRAHRVGEELSSSDEATGQALRCWEFFSDQGALRAACKECVVYRVRAALCFEMLGLGKEVGHGQLFCQNSCEDCAYYRRVKGLKINVLVVSQDGDLIGNLAGEQSAGLSLRFVQNAYEASAAIHDFRPAFAVVDRDLVPDGGRELVRCLAADSRVPGLKIILAVPGAGRRRRKESERGAAEVLVKPFGLDRVTEAVTRLPVECVAPDEPHDP